MLRIVCCVCVVVLFAACNKNYRRLHIEKRVYRDGYYVHVPWERRAPINEYPKPAPYPVDHSRTARTDSTRKYVGGVKSDTTNTTAGSSSSGGSNQSGGSGYGTPPPNGNGGYGNASGPPQNGGTNGTNGAVGSNPNVVTYQPAPPLQYQPDYGSPPLQKPNTIPPVAPTDPVNPPDSTVVSVSPPDTASPPRQKRNIDFPDGEFSLVAELGFYNPVYTEGTEIKAGSYNAGGAMRYTIHPWSRHKLSLEAGLFISQHFIAQDHHKFYPMFTERHDHERLMQWKTRFMLMDHIYVLRSPIAQMDAIELGMFSDISFMSTHVAIDNIGNTKEASFTRNKSRLFGLHYLRNAQFGMTARIANDMWSVFANYRFNSLVTAGPDGGDLPKLVVGATFTFGE